jgi:hypothetical protein
MALEDFQGVRALEIEIVENQGLAIKGSDPLKPAERGA